MLTEILLRLCFVLDAVHGVVDQSIRGDGGFMPVYFGIDGRQVNRRFWICKNRQGGAIDMFMFSRCGATHFIILNYYMV